MGFIFAIEIVVEGRGPYGQGFLIKINGETTVDWTEPPTRMAYQGGEFERKFGMGYFALQSHPDSDVVMMRDLYYRRLP